MTGYPIMEPPFEFVPFEEMKKNRLSSILIGI